MSLDEHKSHPRNRDTGRPFLASLPKTSVQRRGHMFGSTSLVRRASGLAASLLLGALIGLGLPGIADATTSPNLGQCIDAGQYIRSGQYLTVFPNWYRLIMQSDGNLVLYTSSGQTLWDSQTNGHLGAYAVLQGDGNLVVHSATGSVLWSAYVPLPAVNDRLCVQSDGNLVVYSSSNAPLWASNTNHRALEGQTNLSNPFHVAGDSLGQCTDGAEQMFNRWHGGFIDTTNRNAGTPNGNAMYWATNAARHGWAVDKVPRIGSIAVFQPGVDVAPLRGPGHVAWVTAIYPSLNKIAITEMNCTRCGVDHTGGLGVFDTRTISASLPLQYIYVNPPQGTPPAPTPPTPTPPTPTPPTPTPPTPAPPTPTPPTPTPPTPTPTPPTPTPTPTPTPPGSRFTLTVSKSGPGGGTVTSSVGGINCGATCAANFDAGTTVTLTATPAGNSTFAGWSGSCSGTGSCVLAMNAAKTATAVFYVRGTVNVPAGQTLLVRSGPGTSYSVTGSLPNGATVSIVCQTHGSSVNGMWGPTNLWDRLSTGGYASDGFVNTGSNGQVAPSC
jgi:surface antigen